jgi:hypothetical protein
MNYKTELGIFEIGISVFDRVICQQNVFTDDRPKEPRLFPLIAAAQTAVARWAIKKYRLRCTSRDLCWTVTTNGASPRYYWQNDVQL